MKRTRLDLLFYRAGHDGNGELLGGMTVTDTRGLPLSLEVPAVGDLVRYSRPVGQPFNGRVTGRCFSYLNKDADGVDWDVYTSVAVFLLCE